MLDGCSFPTDKIEMLKSAIQKNETLVQCTLGKYETQSDIDFIEGIMERNFQILSGE